MKILAIGNSFTQNACRYIHKIFESAGVPLTLGDATIGGCSLARHWGNVTENRPAYNGKSLPELVSAEKWDVVTFQQQSFASSQRETFYPYIEQLCAYVREAVPDVVPFVYQTWAYRTEHPKLAEQGLTQQDMLERIRSTCDEAAARLGAGIIPVGETFRLMQEETGDATGELTRKNDGSSHCNPYGEYVAGLVWFGALSGKDVDAVTFVPEGFDAALAKKCAKVVLEKYNCN